MVKLLVLSAVIGLVACGGDSPDAGDPDASTGPGGDGPTATGDAGSCEPPDMLIVLDRTLTMSRRPDGVRPEADAAGLASSKWWQANQAIDALLATRDLDRTIRFGLELFPREAAGCVTLAQQLSGTAGSNAACEPAEVLVAPDLGTGAAISSRLDPATTRICFSTPAGQALVGARDALAVTRVDGRAQFVVFITDGADFADTCPQPDPLPVVAELAAAGVKTFVVGFAAPSAQGGVKPEVLNAMACAGRTATDFATRCMPSGTTHVPVDPSPSGPRLYIDAGDAAELQAELARVAGEVCCGCVE